MSSLIPTFPRVFFYQIMESGEKHVYIYIYFNNGLSNRSPNNKYYKNLRTCNFIILRFSLILIIVELLKNRKSQTVC